MVKMFFSRGSKFSRPGSKRNDDASVQNQQDNIIDHLSPNINASARTKITPRSRLMKDFSTDTKPYTLAANDIRQDLTRGQGRPNWVLSTYGAGRGTPASLFEGNEYSPEELRVRFYDMASKGQEAQADQEAIQLWTKAEQDLNNAASHIDDITNFMEEAEKKHPNRYDFLKADGTKTREEILKEAETSNNTSNSSGFGASPFGQPSNNANPFAKPAAATFGQPSQPSAFGASGFGKPAQPSGFGQPAFGQSSFGSPTTATGQQSSPFGQPSATSAFGQPAAASAFGKPAFGASAFGQSAFGQPAQPAPPAQSAVQSPFGQTAATPAFGASAFGQPARTGSFAAPATTSGFGATTSAFGQPAQSSPAFGQPSQPATGFGQTSQPTPAFGQASQPSSGFGQSAFGKAAQPSGFGQSAFGQPAQAATSSPFGQTANASSGFGIGNSGTSAFGQTSQQSASAFAKATETSTTEVSMDAEAPASVPTQAPAPSNAFGTPQSSIPVAQNQPAAATSVPASIQPNNNTTSTAISLTSNAPKPMHYTQTLPQIPPQTNMNKMLISYRGQRVEYLGEADNQAPCYNRPDGRGPEKIWYPEGSATQEVAYLNKDDKILDLQAANEKYTDEIRQQYSYLFDEGRFKDGKIPLVPPIREWCSYDF